MFVCKIQEAVGIVVAMFNLHKKRSGNKYLMIIDPNQIELTDIKLYSCVLNAATINEINNQSL